MKKNPATVSERLLSGEDPQSLDRQERELLESSAEGRAALEALPLVRELDTYGARADGLPPEAIDRSWRAIRHRLGPAESAEAAAEAGWLARLGEWYASLSPRQWATAAVSLAALTLVIVYAVQERPIASLDYVGGEVELVNQETGRIAAARQNEQLFCETSIRTAAAGGLILGFKSGVIATLAGETHAMLQEARDLELEGGSIWVDVEKGHGDFVVHTPEADVRVIGPSFGVERQAGATSVAVVEGVVEVTAKKGGGGRSARLEAGESMEVTAEGELGELMEHDGKFPDWVEALRAQASVARQKNLLPSVGAGGGAGRP